jgi:hypothetical protein
LHLLELRHNTQTGERDARSQRNEDRSSR